MQATCRPEWVGDAGTRTASCSADYLRSDPACLPPVTIIDQQVHSECTGQLKKGSAMQFSVGDKVVHPGHGPGSIAGIESRELMDGPKRYYVIDIPGQGLRVHVPVGKADEAGVRLAISQSRLPQVLSMLRGKPHLLPKDFRERQERILGQLKTGRVMQLAKVVRDLTWHRERAHLTRTDSGHLKQGRDLLAAEMALVSGDDVSDASKLIQSTVTAAMASTPA
ncbi:CarD family transcriptional regulator [Chloroflexota bacterium]